MNEDVRLILAVTVAFKFCIFDMNAALTSVASSIPNSCRYIENKNLMILSRSIAKPNAVEARFVFNFFPLSSQLCQPSGRKVYRTVAAGL